MTRYNVEIYGLGNPDRNPRKKYSTKTAVNKDGGEILYFIRAPYKKGLDDSGRRLMREASDKLALLVGNIGRAELEFEVPRNKGKKK